MCTTIVVGKGRSATGSVLVAHSEELGRNSAHQVAISRRRNTTPGERYPLYSGGDLEQPAEIPRYLATKIFDKNHFPGEHTAGVNEHGVAVVNNMALMRGIPEARAYDVVPGGIIWTEFAQLVLERATTAREGVALLGELCGTYGLSCDSGTMLAVADPEDAWWVEMARDGQWVATRVGADEIVVRANAYRIGEVDFDDHDNAAASASLVKYARDRGWVEDGTFNFAEVYGDPKNQRDVYNLDRHTILESRVEETETVAAADLMRLLRDVFVGTPQYKTRSNGSPFRTGVRTIPCMNTDASAVIELRPELPSHLGNRMWVSMATSLTSTYVPFHLGMTSIESHFAHATASYDSTSAYWLFAELAKLADYGYSRCIDTITAAWQELESEVFAALPAIETRALALEHDAACALLTEFDNARAAAAIDRVKQLLPEVKTKVFYEP